MATRELICRLQRYSVQLFVYSFCMLCAQPSSAQMRRGLKLNPPDPSVVRQPEQAQIPQAAQTATSANLTAPTVQQIAGDVYEYSYILPTGPGRYHSVGVHRVVRVRNGAPLATHNSVFLAHGSVGSFDENFMNATETTQSFAVYLARNGIDVWGIDYGWALVPLSETDFTFMENWGMQRDADDLEAAILFARIVRATTGGDGGRLALLGFSYSGGTVLVLANEETKKSCQARQIKAIIPIDFTFLNNDPTFQSLSCAGEAFYRQYLSQGGYFDDSGSYYEIIGSLAQTDPNGVSPVLPPWTNLQTSLVLGAAPWLFQGYFPPASHLVAGVFGPGGTDTIPVGLQYTTVSTWNKAFASTSPWMPIPVELEEEALTCGDANPEYSDSLGLIRIPVLYIGAAGGQGNLGLYTLTQLGSQDVQQYVVSFYPPDQAALDYGHVDLMLADNAQDVVWSKILHWLQQDNSCLE